MWSSAMRGTDRRYYRLRRLPIDRSTTIVDMSLDRYVTLGRSGLRVSPLCLGTMTFGEEWGWGSSVAESEALLSRFLDRGGNFIDTANAYTKGHSEVIIGDYFAKTPGR